MPARGMRGPGRSPGGVSSETGGLHSALGGREEGSGRDPPGGWVGGGLGVQKAAGAVPFCVPAEAAVIFVCVSFELMRGPRPGNLTRGFPAHRALARLPKVRVREGAAASESQVWLRRAQAKRLHPKQ